MLLMEERPPIQRVAVNILNKQLRTAIKGWSSSLGVGQSADSSLMYKHIMLQTICEESPGPGLILWYD
jgi:hypothetical protein